MAKSTPRTMTAPARVGDAERARCAELLSDGYSTGRLTHGEFEQRMEFALAARSQSELDILLADVAPVDLAAPRRPVVRMITFAAVLGVLTFLAVMVVGGDASVAFALWLFGCLAGGAGALVRGAGRADH